MFWNKYPEIYQELVLVGKYIETSIKSKNSLLTGISQSLFNAGGKRLRPGLLITSSKFGKYDRNKSIHAASAVEVLHTATLIHDDIVDKAELRRGKKTISGEYGADLAVYTGDFLFTKAVLMLSRDLPVDRLEYIAKALKSICEGEVNQYQDKYNLDTSIYSYIKRISRKTAVLFTASCGLGAHLGGCKDELVKNISKFGFDYGVAFQIRDDLNDFLSNEKELGKPVLLDISGGILTLPVIYTLRDRKVKKAMESYFKEGQSSQSGNELYELVINAGGIEKTRILLDRIIDRGVKSLTKLPQNKYKEVLEDLLMRLQMETHMPR